MYAIIRDGGHQYRVSEGDKILIQRREANEGAELELGEVLFMGGEVGSPLVSGASVKAKVLGEVKGDKIYVQKFKRRKNYRRRTGHRQRYTHVEIVSLCAN